MTADLDHSAEHPEARDAEGLTLHEERLVTSGQTRAHEIGQVRLRKRIVVEELTVTVPVRREIVDVVRVEADGTETVIDAADPTYEPRVEDRTGRVAYGEDAREVPEQAAAHDDSEPGVVCYEERPVLTTEVFAVERVRLDRSRHETTVAETHEVRREEAEIVQESRRN